MKARLPLGGVVAILVVAALILAFISWKMLGSGSSAPSGAVKLDLNKIKQDMKTDGFGGH